MSRPAPLTVGLEGGLSGTPDRSASSSLEPHETSDTDRLGLDLEGIPDCHPDHLWPTLSREESTLRHSGWRMNRLRVWESLKRTRQGGNRLNRFACCGSSAWVQFSPSRDAHRITCNTCKDRWCVPCQRKRATEIRSALAEMPQGARFMTLTLRSNNLSLKEQTDRLYRAFRDLRRLKWFKERCTGGIAMLEIKLTKTSRWHPHLHCLILGQYIDQKELSMHWLAITGDSSIVDIRKVKSRAEVAGYVAKYLTKPVSQTIYTTPEKLDEAIVSLKGRRQILPWGIGREIMKNAKENAKDEGENDWINMCPLDALIREAQGGSDQARILLITLTNGNKHDPP